MTTLLQCSNCSLKDEGWPWTTIDHRVDELLWMSSTRPLLTLLMAYLLMVFVGPIAMRNQKPFNVKWLMVVYNLLIVLISLYIVAQFVINAIDSKYNLMCDYYNTDKTQEAEKKIVQTTHLYMLTKPLEWLDSFFFIIRKKGNQLSGLHVYHHMSVFVIAWVYVRWVPSGCTIVFMLLNTAVHVVMYFYYALSACGPKFEKYLWWKKYLTLLQLIQFTLMISYTIYSIVWECNYPMFLKCLGAAYGSSFWFLFLMFYRDTYKPKTTIKPQMEQANDVAFHNGLTLNVNREGFRNRNIVANF